jgi:hypothetical protein
LNTIRQQTKDEIEQSTDSEQQNSELIKPVKLINELKENKNLLN